MAAIMVALVMATVAIYWQVRGFEFIDLDDNYYIFGNSILQRGLNRETFLWIWRLSNEMTYWHPLIWLSFFVDHELFGLNPAWYHLENLLFHTANALLLFLIVTRLTGRVWRSAFVAALFALHPLNVESVVWAVERKTVLSSLFWFLTTLAYLHYLRRPAWRRYLLVCVTFAIGLMGKSLLVTLPFTLLLLDYWPLGRFDRGENPPAGSTGFSRFLTLPAARLFLEKVPLLMLSLLSAALTVISVRGSGGVEEIVGTPLLEKLANAVLSYVTYPIKLFWPVNLSALYPLQHSFPSWQVAGAVVMLAAVTLFALLLRRKHPWFLVGWFWYLGVMLPMIGIVRGGLWPAMADRFTYIPHIGLFIIITWGGAEVTQKWRQREAVRAGCAFAILLVLMILTGRQVGYWRNTITLFEHAVSVSGETADFAGVLGTAYFERGEHGKALELFRRAERLRPESNDTELALGRIALMKKDLPAALQYLQKAWEKNGTDPGTLFWLGEAYRSMGDRDRAIACYNEVILSRELDVRAFRRRASEERERLRQEVLPQVALMRKAAENPADGDAVLALAEKLEALGYYDETVEQYRRLEQAGGGNFLLSFRLGQLLVKVHRPREAVEYFTRSLALQPLNREILDELGSVYLELGEYRRARALFERSVTADPTSPVAPAQLGIVSLRLGEKEQALRYLRNVAMRFPDFRPRVLPVIDQLRQVGINE